jgi:sugar lactone lactonase YvrE
MNVAAGDFGYCNGIAVRPDRRALLVDDSITSEVIELDIVSPGQLANRRTIAVLTPPPVLASGASLLDGMTFDAAGRLYVAHYSSGVVDVLDPAGALLRSYDVGITASNVAFRR